MVTVDNLIKRFHSISWRYGMHDVFRDTISMAALSLANAFEYAPYTLGQDEQRREYWKEHNERAYKRELAYLELARKYNASELKAIAEIVGELAVLLSDCTLGGPFDDYLGKLFMLLEIGNKNTGQFFTPYSVSKMMAQINISAPPKEDILTVSDPTVGGGGLLIAIADTLNSLNVNYAEHLLAHGCDVDIRCVHMAYLQLAWAGVPAIIQHGNSLTMEMWDVWETPAYLFQKQRFDYAFREKQKQQIVLRPVIGPYFQFKEVL